jgi:hypothetical protein
VGIISKIVLRRCLQAAVVLFALSILCALDANAGAPRVTAFVYSDSLAMAVNCSDLLTQKRVDMLNNGYPLSFVLSISLLEYSALWSDRLVARSNSRFRISHRNWDDLVELKMSDFSSNITSNLFNSLDDVVQELDDRLFETLLPIAELDSTKEYYFDVSVEYRNLTFDDVKSADRWLRSEEIGLSDSTSHGGASLKDQLLGFLWDIAGPKGEEERIRGERFIISDLRRGRRQSP